MSVKKINVLSRTHYKFVKLEGIRICASTIFSRGSVSAALFFPPRSFQASNYLTLEIKISFGLNLIKLASG